MDQSGGIRNQKGGIWDPDQHCFLGIRDQAVPFLWDQGAKFVKYRESRIRDLGTKMESTSRSVSL